MKITLFAGKTFDYEKALGFPIKVIKSATAKRLTLRIDAKTHQPVLTIPKRCSSARAVDFVDSQQDWITNNLARLPQTKNFSHGDVISIMGQDYTISHQPQLRSGDQLQDGQLIISGQTEFLHRRVSDFLKKLALQELSQRSQEQAKQLNCNLNNVCIKDTKSRWGSCSSNQNINYNWRIIMAPDFVIDYMIAHEVAHLAHQDHSSNFWQCVENMCPNYKEGRAWLKIKGKNLYTYE